MIDKLYETTKNYVLIVYVLVPAIVIFYLFSKQIQKIIKYILLKIKQISLFFYNEIKNYLITDHNESQD